MNEVHTATHGIAETETTGVTISEAFDATDAEVNRPTFLSVYDMIFPSDTIKLSALIGFYATRHAAESALLEYCDE